MRAVADPRLFHDAALPHRNPLERAVMLALLADLILRSDSLGAPAANRLL